jgi:hypothetical protein
MLHCQLGVYTTLFSLLPSLFYMSKNIYLAIAYKPIGLLALMNSHVPMPRQYLNGTPQMILDKWPDH